MAAITVAQIQGLFKLKYNGISNADFLLVLQVAHDEICSRVQLYPESHLDVFWTSVDVTAGRREWPLDVDLRRGWQARYFKSASSSFELNRTNTHKLDAQDPDWRVASSGTPEQWYESGGQIGLYPKPSRNPTSGYPRVRLYSMKRKLLSLTSALPAQVSSGNAWVFKSLANYAWLRDRESGAHADYETKARMEMKKLVDDINSINAGDDRVVQTYVPGVVNA